MNTNTISTHVTPFALQPEQVAPFVWGFVIGAVVLSLGVVLLVRFFSTPPQGGRQT